MPPLRNPSAWPLVTIQAGAGLFIAALAASVVFEPAVWILHTLQALIYLGVVLLVRRNSDWGFGAGFTIALLWNAANLFATAFIRGIDVRGRETPPIHTPIVMSRNALGISRSFGRRLERRMANVNVGSMFRIQLDHR